MRVKELIEKLSQFPEDAKLLMVADPKYTTLDSWIFRYDERAKMVIIDDPKE